MGSMTMSKMSRASSSSKYKISVNHSHKHAVRKHHASSGSDMDDETSVLTMNTMNTMETSSSHASMAKAQLLFTHQQQLSNIAEIKEMGDAPETEKDIEISHSLMPLTELIDQIEPEEYGKFSVPRKVRKRGVVSIGPGLEAKERFMPYEKNIHASTYLMNLVNIRPRDELPNLDVLGEYLGFYDDSGRYRNCPVKYCSGLSEHEMHLLEGIKERGMGPLLEDGDDKPMMDPDYLHRVHFDADVVIKTKFPLWF